MLSHRRRNESTMYRSIVVGTDGSATAEDAVRRAAELAQICGSRLTVVSAFRAVSATASLAMAGAGAGIGVGIDLDELLEQQRREAEEALEHAVMALGGTISPATTARPGDPADVLLNVAAEIDADLIVMGNRGMYGAKRFLLGSVPNRVAHHARCSVLIVQTC